jgi:cysteine-rich repeat protein
LDGPQLEVWVSTTDPVVAPLDAATLGDFVQVVAVLDLPGDLLQLYVNGAFVMQVPMTRTSWTGGNAPTIATATEDSIGGNDRDQLDDVTPFVGDLARIVVYEEARDAAAVAASWEGVHCGLDDPDGDGLLGACDPCPLDDPGDSDGDGVCDSDDGCAGDDTADADGDGLPDACDACPVDATGDTDGDGVCDTDDVCPGVDDGLPDACSDITLAWDGALATPTSWPELTGTYAGMDWVLPNALRVAPLATTHLGLAGAVFFDGSAPGAGIPTFADLPGNPTNDPVTLELWARPSDRAGFEVLFESGGAQNGISVVLDDDVVIGTVSSGGVSTVSATLPDTGDFSQIALVFEPGIDRFELYLDGELADAVAAVPNLWTGGNGPAIGGPGGPGDNIGGNLDGALTGAGTFVGEIALLAVHEAALSTDDVRRRYDTVHCGDATDGDADGDGVCDSADLCVGTGDDSDGDGICDDLDLCADGDDAVDVDLDGIPDACDDCTADSDGDGTCDTADACPDDPAKVAPGDCGCGLPDEDITGDGIADCTVCGDGVVELPETCDDGNRQRGDGCSDYCAEEALILGPVLPGEAGTVNTWFVARGTPGGNVRILVSDTLGSTPMSGCPNLRAPFAWSVDVGALTPLANGTGTYTRDIPGSLIWRGYGFVAVDMDTCRMSNLVYEIF